MPEGGERKLSDMLVRPENPHFDNAEAKAKSFTERATMETFKVIDELKAEVEGMTVAKRFKQTGKVGDEAGPYGNRVTNPLLRHLPEAEHKRQQLLRDLEQIRAEMARNAGALEGVIMDIEATKRDYSGES